MHPRYVALYTDQAIEKIATSLSRLGGETDLKVVHKKPELTTLFTLQRIADVIESLANSGIIIGAVEPTILLEDLPFEELKALADEWNVSKGGKKAEIAERIREAQKIPPISAADADTRLEEEIQRLRDLLTLNEIDPDTGEFTGELDLEASDGASDGALENAEDPESGGDTPEGAEGPPDGPGDAGDNPGGDTD